VVIRNDTIVYERYSNYKPDQRWSSFSVAKSFLSAVLGEALEKGIISNLDDPVIKYLPELTNDPDFKGLTLRHLMNMQSGFEYTRADGSSMWHDLKSSDAKFYYTTNMRKSLMDMHGVQAPPAPWSYKDSDAELLGWVLNRAAGKAVAKQLDDEVWKKIGTEDDATFNMDRNHARQSFGRISGDGVRLRAIRSALSKRRQMEWRTNPPADWVKASTTIDKSRTEPEVLTWYQMQHNRLWWLPMHNWDNERDFFADGSRGQRIYVHPPTKTIVVQLSEDSEQDFPFRKVAHYLAGETYRYPRGIVGLTIQAMNTGGADSARAAFRRLSAEEREHPERYFINREGILGYAAQLKNEGKGAQAGVL
jgi:CubicO group peptidase (beta-lactamase class C family)